MRDKFLVFGAPSIGDDEINEVVAVLRSGWLGTGPRVAEFEKRFAEYKGVDPDLVAAVNSCTAALFLSLLAAGVGDEDEVITTPLTFCATVNAIIHAGAKPVLVDVEPDSMNINVAQLEAAVTSRTKAIVPVHFAGRPCNMEMINKMASKHGLKIIEDCAHAIETEYKGLKTGTLGDFGCFSFYVTKNVVTGEGGMIIGKDAAAMTRIKRLALHGMSKDAWKRFGASGYKHYDVEECGYKYNMMDLQAAIGLHQLHRVEENWKRRESIWNRYQEAFSELPIRRPAITGSDIKHAYHLYTVLISDNDAGVNRDSFLHAMTGQNIGVGVHYQSIPEYSYYQKNYFWRPEMYPEAMRIGRSTVSLPISAAMNDADVNDVIEAVKKVFNA